MGNGDDAKHAYATDSRNDRVSNRAYSTNNCASNYGDEK